MPASVPMDGGAERLVSAMRLVFSGVSVVFLESLPLGMFPNQLLLTRISLLYFTWALVAAVLRYLLHRGLSFYGVATHAFDVAFAIAIVWVSGDPTTPFRVFSVFAILAAGLRFGWMAIAGTLGALLLGHLALYLYLGEMVLDPLFQYGRAGIWLVGFILVAVVLAVLKRREERVRIDLDHLASWPREPVLDPRHCLRDTLEHVATTLNAGRAVLLWEEGEEPWLHVARWERGEFTWDREAPDRYEPVVTEALKRSSFYTRNLHVDDPKVFYRIEADIYAYRGRPVHPELAPMLAERSLLSVCVEGESLEGRLFVGDAPPPTADGLLAAELIGDLVAHRLDQCQLIFRTRENAVGEERVRLARDLHDGLLQSLTGVALHLESARRLVDADPAASKESLQQIQEVIAGDQRELRKFIQQLRPLQKTAAEAMRLTGRLGDLGNRFQNQFGLDVRLHSESLSPLISEEMRRQIFSIVNEALANVARHSGAQSVDVDLRTEGDQVRIRVVDDGRGFPFRGRYDLRDLTAMRRGPLSLKERIASLHGDLIIESTDSGSRLDIRIPRNAEGGI